MLINGPGFFVCFFSPRGMDDAAEPKSILNEGRRRNKRRLGPSCMSASAQRAVLHAPQYANKPSLEASEL